MSNLNNSEWLLCGRWYKRFGCEEEFNLDGERARQVIEECATLHLGFDLTEVRWPIVSARINTTARPKDIYHKPSHSEFIEPKAQSRNEKKASKVLKNLETQKKMKLLLAQRGILVS